MNRIHPKAAAVFVPAFILACQPRALTRQEAQEALDESQIATQASALTSGSIEITTEFTIGQAVEAAAEELRNFYASQLPCAEVTLENATLSVQYGQAGEGCLYRGQRYTGLHQVTIAANDEGEVIVDHVWDQLANDQVMVSGAATVTWDLADPSRHVEHTLTWTRLSDGRAGTGTGDRVQRPLEGGLFEGISVNGHRSWQGESGDWDLSINDVEMRWVDPVPQSGSYELDTPFDKSLSLRFDRVDSTTIQVTIEGPKRSFDFNVKSLPAESE